MRLSVIDRFRPVGAPGAAGTGVPAVDGRGPADELAPVFAALRDDVRAAERVAAEARDAASAAVDEATAAAVAIVAQARIDAAAARARAAADVETAARDADSRAIVDARREAERIDAVAAERMPAAVRLVIERLRRDLDAPGGAGETS